MFLNPFKNYPVPSKSGYEFKMQHSFDIRKKEATNLIKKYPDKIPIILEKATSSSIPELGKQKFLLPKDFTIGQFLYIIRKHLKLEPSQAIFLFVNNLDIPSITQSLGSVYADLSDKDGFLYMTYSAEHTFG